MSYSRQALKSLLLDLLANPVRLSPERLTGLQTDDWESIDAMVREHRLGPLLHWQLTQTGLSRHLPEHFLARLGKQHHRWALRALQMRRNLIIASQTLARREIPCVALKGAWLAFHAYPNPALRPLRDIDLLVPRTRALEAFDLLTEAGFSPDPSQAPAGPEHLVVEVKNLPPLHISGHLLELHTQLMCPETLPRPWADPAFDESLWSRLEREPADPYPLDYLPIETRLMHLIVHAVYDHRFNNGPLIFWDVHLLLKARPVDWPSFWQMARHGGWTRGCQLLFRLTERYLGPLPVELTRSPEWKDAEELDEAFLDECALQSLNNTSMKPDTRLYLELAQKTGLGDRIRYLAKKLFPSVDELRRSYPVGSAVALPWCYIRHLYGRLFERFPSYLKLLRQPQMKAEAQAMHRIEMWLNKPEN